MTVNGENIPLNVVGSDPSLTALIRHMQLSENRIAVELNGVLLDRAAYNATMLKDSDNVELIHYVGGG